MNARFWKRGFVASILIGIGYVFHLFIETFVVANVFAFFGIPIPTFIRPRLSVV